MHLPQEWGVTQLDHPLALFPSPRTCLKEGIQGTKCSESCLGSCKTPSCAMSCACACTTTKDREALARVLKGKGQEVKAMSTEFSLLDKQATLWREGLSAQYEHGVRKQQALHVASNGGLESQAHAQARKIAGSVKALPPKFDAATDSAGFSWDAMEPSSALHYRSPYAHEADEEVMIPMMLLMTLKYARSTT